MRIGISLTSVYNVRDPREGATSFVTSARVDAQIAVVEATAIANLVNVEP